MVKNAFILYLYCTFVLMTACGGQSNNSEPEDNLPPDNSEGFTSNMRLFGGGLQMCGISQDKQVYCWGKDNSGEIGSPKSFPENNIYEPTSTLSPLKVNGLPNIETMDADYSRSCAVDDSGLVWCWGSNFVSGISNYLPEVVPQLNSVEQINASQISICASNQDTELLCWGYNKYQHLNVADNSELVETPSLFNWDQLEKSNLLAMASDSSCLLTSNGIPYCLGYNYAGGLGTGSDELHITEPQAVIISEGQRFSQISAGFNHFCALDTDKNAYCWGYNLDVGQPINTPTKVAGLESIVKITSFYDGSCALTEAGEVWCWGENDSGVLGYKSPHNSYWKNQAVQIELPGKATDIGSAEYFNCAVGDESFQEDIYCWGSIASEHYLSTATDQPARENYHPIPLTPYTIEE